MKYFKFLLLVITGAGLTACGGGGNIPTEASGVVTTAQASSNTMITNLNGLVANIGTNLANPNNVSPGAGITSSAVPFNLAAVDPYDACSTVTGNLTDSDGDGIVAEKNYSFDCHGIDTGFYKTDKTGTATIKDLDETTTVSNGGGYYYSFDLSLNSPGAFSADWEGFYQMENTSTAWTYTSQFYSTFTETHSGQDLEGGQASNFVHVMKPDDPSDFYKRGTVVTDGFYRIIVKGDDGNGNILDWDFTFKLKGRATYERQSINACHYFYRDGYIEFEDTIGTKMRFDYFCDHYTYSVNGTVVLTQN
jgi:hypothetical protein